MAATTELCETDGTLARSKLRARRQEGKRRRERVPRDAHSHWNPHSNRDPIATLKHTNADRIKRFLPIRCGRMLESPLAFLRGAPLVMARDLATTPRTDIKVQACGDAHLLNFGLFASPERHLLFDLNDFDETLPGPWEWDVKRLVVSLAVASRELGHGEDKCEECSRLCATSYRHYMRKYASMPRLKAWYSRVDGDKLSLDFHHRDRDDVHSYIDKARKRKPDQAVAKFTENGANHQRLKDDPPVTTHSKALLSAAQLQEILRTYRESFQEDRRHLFDGYRVVDWAAKVVGVSSVGTRCFAVLLASGPRKRDHIVLQLKEATPSVFEGLAGPPWHGNQGRRTVVGQRLIQNFTDIFLGWGTDGHRDYYIRQLRDMKSHFTPQTSCASELRDYASLCGWVLARAHARSGDAAHIAGYLGKNESFDEAIAQFAKVYVVQNERDFKAFKTAVRAGRLPAETGV